MKIGLQKWNFFGVEEFFRMNFYFKNWCKNEFNDNNEKSWSLSRNRVSHKIDFTGVWPLNGHAASVGVNLIIIDWIFWVLIFSFDINILNKNDDFASKLTPALAELNIIYDCGWSLWRAVTVGDPLFCNFRNQKSYLR